MYIYKIAVAVASCDHQKSKLRAVAEGFWVAELRVRQVKIGRNSSFVIFQLTQYCWVL